MAVTTITLTHTRASDLGVGSGEPSRQALNKAVHLLEGVAVGAYGGSAFDLSQTQATGTLTIESGTGSVGGSINGVAITVTWATSDTASATALAAAINASGSALVSQHVTATSDAGVVTLTAKAPGPVGNAVTLAASGTGVTASGARLTGGTATTYTF